MTPEELKTQLIEEQKKAIVAFQTANDEKLKGKIGETELKAVQDKIEAKLAEINTAIARLQAPPAGGQQKPEEKSKSWWSGFRKALLGQKMDEKESAVHAESRAWAGPSEGKTMMVSDNTTGGYYALPEFVNDMIKIDVLYSPIRSLARVRSTTNRSVQIPKKTSSASASWVSEIGTRSETTNPKIGLEELPVHEMFALAKVSRQDLEDAAFDLQSFLRDEFAEQFGVAEGTAFVSGNGVGKPQGFLSHPDVTGFTGVTTSAKITADDLKSLFYSLNDRYAKNATWVWKRSSTLAISLLTNATTGAYLWRPGLELGSPGNVLGAPFVECVDMPAEGSSYKAVAIADWRSFYYIVDRIVMEILVDPYSSKSTGSVEISARKRVGGQVVLAEAGKIYTLKA